MFHTQQPFRCLDEKKGNSTKRGETFLKLKQHFIAAALVERVHLKIVIPLLRSAFIPLRVTCKDDLKTINEIQIQV